MTILMFNVNVHCRSEMEHS